MKTIVTQINGSLDPKPMTLWEKMRVKLSPRVKYNPHRVVIPYNQHKDPYCTAFASAGCFTYNTGKRLTNEQIYAWATPILKGKGSTIDKICPLFAKDHGARSLKVNLNSKEAHQILSAGYALVVSTKCPPAFWSDGIDDGVINGREYKRDMKGGHAIVFYSEDGYYDFLLNSWGDYEKKGKHNTYKIDAQDMLDDGLLKELAYFIY